MRKIITFLGRRPLETSYVYNGERYSGRVFAEVLHQFEKYDQMLVCVTDEARVDSWPVVAELGDPRIIPVSIPRGENTGEMWSLFDAILPHIEIGDQVIFDITHGLRSIPFLIFLFAAYIKTARKASIEAIYYGGLELGDKNSGKPAPVINLSEFQEMLDWLTATNRFVHTGDGRGLAELLLSAKERSPDPDKSKSVESASKSLMDVSQAALLCQPFTLMNTVPKLDEDLSRTQEALEQVARPFGVLRDQIVSTFKNFGIEDQNDDRKKIIAEYHLLTWYFENNQLIQALTLAREWLIDAVTFRLGRPLDYQLSARNRMERAISGLAMVGQTRKDEQTGEDYLFSPSDLNEFGRIIYDSWTEKDLIKDIWITLLPVRNALDHAEHQKGPLSLKNIFKKAEKVKPLLNTLVETWDLKS